jgi:Uma2 family endonuclease
MSTAARDAPPMTVEAFLAYVDARPDRERWELLDGRPVMMTSPTIRHELIAGNIDRTLASALRPRGCWTHRDMTVARHHGDWFGPRPDVLVRCGPLHPTARSISDPAAIFEVLSSSTLANDRGYKFTEYLTFGTMRLLALVYQDEARVEVWSRADEAPWPEGPAVLARPEQTIDVLGAQLSLAAIYQDAA